MGVRAIGEQVQVGNEVAFGHLLYYIGLATNEKCSPAPQITLEFFSDAPDSTEAQDCQSPASIRFPERIAFSARRDRPGRRRRWSASWQRSSQAAAKTAPPIDPASLAFLKELAAATIESARVRPGQSRGGMGPNTTGITLITPGGNYPALWTRDFAMSLDCGLIGPAEILSQLRLIARCQNGEKERRLKSGAIVPPFAIVDHVNFAGGAVFYPGTYSSGEDQGAPPFGPLPPVDDHFYFIHIAYALWRDTGDAKFLGEMIGGRSLLDRLEGAFHSPAVRSENRRGRRPRKNAVPSASAFRIRSICSGRCRLPRCCVIARLGNWPICARPAEGPRRPRSIRRTAETIAAHFAAVFADPRQARRLAAGGDRGRQAAGRLGDAFRPASGDSPRRRGEEGPRNRGGGRPSAGATPSNTGRGAPRAVRSLLPSEPVLGSGRQRREHLSERGILAHADRLADRGPATGRSDAGPSRCAIGSSAICASAIFAKAEAAARRGNVSESTWPARRIPST